MYRDFLVREEKPHKGTVVWNDLEYKTSPPDLIESIHSQSKSFLFEIQTLLRIFVLNYDSSNCWKIKSFHSIAG